MNPLRIYLALFVSYFGDYCSLIGLTELAKQLGGSTSALVIFVTYSLPPFIFFFIADKWSRHQSLPARQLGFISIVGSAIGLSLFAFHSFVYLVAAVFMLGLVKQANRVLLNVYIKANYPEDVAPKVLGNTVTIRFFIMVFGGALGAYLGGLGRFDLIYTIDAVSFLIAAACFLTAKERRVQMESEERPKRPALEFLPRTVMTFGLVPAIWVLAAMSQSWVFMALEYPMLTNELGISTALIGVVWGGHLLGTILARRAVSGILNRKSLVGPLISFAAMETLAFGTLGAFGSGLWLITFQMTLGIFFLVGSEILSNAHLMQRSSLEEYPIHNLLFRSLEMGIQFISSIIPLFLTGLLTLQQVNLTYMVFLAFLVPFLMFSLSFYQSVRKGQHGLSN